jgi:hypothetical protein
MSPPKIDWRMNINTVITVVGFLLTIITGAMTFQSFKTSMELWKDESDRRIVALEAEFEALGNEAEISRLQNAVTAEKMANIISTLARIERKLDQPQEEEERP